MSHKDKKDTYSKRISEKIKELLKEYLKNIDFDMSYNNAHFVFEVKDVEVRSDILKKFGIPLELTKGKIQEIKVTIQSITFNKPILIEVSGVNLDMRTIYLSRDYKKDYKSFRQKILDEWEKNHREFLQNLMKKESIFERMMINQMIPMKIEINNIKMTITDTVTSPVPRKIALVIGNVTSYGCDPQWEPIHQQKEEMEEVRRIFNISKAYVNIYQEKSTKGDDFDQHHCENVISRENLFIQPLDFHVKVQFPVIKNPNLRKIPKLHIEVSIESPLLFDVSFNKLKFLSSFLNYLQKIKKVEKYWIHRPELKDDKVNKNMAVEWFKYAFRVVREEVRNRKKQNHDFSSIIEKIVNTQRYIEYYKTSHKLIIAPWIIYNDCSEDLQALENTMSLEDILYSREIAFTELITEGKAFCASGEIGEGYKPLIHLWEFYVNDLRSKWMNKNENRSTQIELSPEERTDLMLLANMDKDKVILSYLKGEPNHPEDIISSLKINLDCIIVNISRKVKSNLKMSNTSDKKIPSMINNQSNENEVIEQMRFYQGIYMSILHKSLQKTKFYEYLNDLDEDELRKIILVEAKVDANLNDSHPETEMSDHNLLNERDRENVKDRDNRFSNNLNILNNINNRAIGSIPLRESEPHYIASPDVKYKSSNNQNVNSNAIPNNLNPLNNNPFSNNVIENNTFNNPNNTPYTGYEANVPRDSFNSANLAALYNITENNTNTNAKTRPGTNLNTRPYYPVSNNNLNAFSNNNDSDSVDYLDEFDELNDIQVDDLNTNMGNNNAFSNRESIPLVMNNQLSNRAPGNNYGFVRDSNTSANRMNNINRNISTNKPYDNLGNVNDSNSNINLNLGNVNNNPINDLLKTPFNSKQRKTILSIVFGQLNVKRTQLRNTAEDANVKIHSFNLIDHNLTYTTVNKFNEFTNPDFSGSYDRSKINRDFIRQLFGQMFHDNEYGTFSYLEDKHLDPSEAPNIYFEAVFAKFLADILIIQKNRDAIFMRDFIHERNFINDFIYKFGLREIDLNTESVAIDEYYQRLVIYFLLEKDIFKDKLQVIEKTIKQTKLNYLLHEKYNIFNKKFINKVFAKGVSKNMFRSKTAKFNHEEREVEKGDNINLNNNMREIKHQHKEENFTNLNDQYIQSKNSAINNPINAFSNNFNINTNKQNKNTPTSNISKSKKNENKQSYSLNPVDVEHQKEEKIRCYMIQDMNFVMEEICVNLMKYIFSSMYPYFMNERGIQLVYKKGIKVYCDKISERLREENKRSNLLNLGIGSAMIGSSSFNNIINNNSANFTSTFIPDSEYFLIMKKTKEGREYPYYIYKENDTIDEKDRKDSARKATIMSTATKNAFFKDNIIKPEVVYKEVIKEAVKDQEDKSHINNKTAYKENVVVIPHENNAVIETGKITEFKDTIFDENKSTLSVKMIKELNVNISNETLAELMVTAPYIIPATNEQNSFAGNIISDLKKSYLEIYETLRQIKAKWKVMEYLKDLKEKKMQNKENDQQQYEKDSFEMNYLLSKLRYIEDLIKAKTSINLNISTINFKIIDKLYFVTYEKISSLTLRISNLKMINNKMNTLPINSKDESKNNCNGTNLNVGVKDYFNTNVPAGNKTSLINNNMQHGTRNININADTDRNFLDIIRDNNSEVNVANRDHINTVIKEDIRVEDRNIVNSSPKNTSPLNPLINSNNNNFNANIITSSTTSVNNLKNFDFDLILKTFWETNISIDKIYLLIDDEFSLLETNLHAKFLSSIMPNIPFLPNSILDIKSNYIKINITPTLIKVSYIFSNLSYFQNLYSKKFEIVKKKKENLEKIKEKSKSDNTSSIIAHFHRKFQKNLLKILENKNRYQELISYLKNRTNTIVYYSIGKFNPNCNEREVNNCNHGIFVKFQEYDTPIEENKYIPNLTNKTAKTLKNGMIITESNNEDIFSQKELENNNIFTLHIPILIFNMRDTLFYMEKQLWLSDVFTFSEQNLNFEKLKIKFDSEEQFKFTSFEFLFCKLFLNTTDFMLYNNNDIQGLSDAEFTSRDFPFDLKFTAPAKLKLNNVYSQKSFYYEQEEVLRNKIYAKIFPQGINEHFKSKEDILSYLKFSISKISFQIFAKHNSQIFTFYNNMKSYSSLEKDLKINKFHIEHIGENITKEPVAFSSSSQGQPVHQGKTEGFKLKKKINEINIKNSNKDNQVQNNLINPTNQNQIVTQKFSTHRIYIHVKDIKFKLFYNTHNNHSNPMLFFVMNEISYQENTQKALTNFSNNNPQSEENFSRGIFNRSPIEAPKIFTLSHLFISSIKIVLSIPSFFRPEDREEDRVKVLDPEKMKRSFDRMKNEENKLIVFLLGNISLKYLQVNSLNQVDFEVGDVIKFGFAKREGEKVRPQDIESINVEPILWILTNKEINAYREDSIISEESRIDIKGVRDNVGHIGKETNNIISNPNNSPNLNYEGYIFNDSLSKDVSNSNYNSASNNNFNNDNEINSNINNVNQVNDSPTYNEKDKLKEKLQNFDLKETDLTEGNYSVKFSFVPIRTQRKASISSDEEKSALFFNLMKTITTMGSLAQLRAEYTLNINLNVINAEIPWYLFHYIYYLRNHIRECAEILRKTNEKNLERESENYNSNIDNSQNDENFVTQNTQGYNINTEERRLNTITDKESINYNNVQHNLNNQEDTSLKNLHREKEKDYIKTDISFVRESQPMMKLKDAINQLKNLSSVRRASKICVDTLNNARHSEKKETKEKNYNMVKLSIPFLNLTMKHKNEKNQEITFFDLTILKTKGDVIINFQDRTKDLLLVKVDSARWKPYECRYPNLIVKHETSRSDILELEIKLNIPTENLVDEIRNKLLMPKEHPDDLVRVIAHVQKASFVIVNKCIKDMVNFFEHNSECLKENPFKEHYKLLDTIEKGEQILFKLKITDGAMVIPESSQSANLLSMNFKQGSIYFKKSNEVPKLCVEAYPKLLIIDKKACFNVKSFMAEPNELCPHMRIEINGFDISGYFYIDQQVDPFFEAGEMTLTVRQPQSDSIVMSLRKKIWEEKFKSHVVTYKPSVLIDMARAEINTSMVRKIENKNLKQIYYFSL
jgi:hypothetical protein